MEEQKLLRVHVKALEEAKEQYDTTLKSPPIVVTSDEPLWKYAITVKRKIHNLLNHYFRWESL